MDIENKLTEREVVVLKHSEKLESFQGSDFRNLKNSLSKPLSRGQKFAVLSGHYSNLELLEKLVKWVDELHN